MEARYAESDTQNQRSWNHREGPLARCGLEGLDYALLIPAEVDGTLLDLTLLLQVGPIIRCLRASSLATNHNKHLHSTIPTHPGMASPTILHTVQRPVHQASYQHTPSQ